MTVDLLVTIDPTTPPNVPKNVARAVNLYRPNGVFDTLPFFRGVALQSDAPGGSNVQNVNIRTDPRDLMEPGTDHFNIEKKKKIHEVVIAEVLSACPEWPAWSAAHGGVRPRVASSPNASPPTLSAAGAQNVGRAAER